MNDQTVLIFKPAAVGKTEQAIRLALAGPLRASREGGDPSGITLSVCGFLIDELPDLGTASLTELREAEWSGREPSRATGGAWHSCQCCGAVKIDGKGHKRGCAMAAALAARAE